jgi:hypothetical protein
MIDVMKLRKSPTAHIDIDSVIVLVQGGPLGLTQALNILPTSPPTYALDKSNHVKVMLNNTWRPLNRIPNMVVGLIGGRGKVLAMLAERFQAQGGALPVPRDLVEVFYNKGLRKAILTVMHNHPPSMPASYAAAMVTYRASRGPLGTHGFQVPGHYVDAIMKQVVENLKDEPCFRGMFFMIELRGIKGEGSVPFSQPEGRISLFKKAIECLAEETWTSQLNTTYVDLAVEFYAPNVWLRMSKHHLADLLCWAFPQLDKDRARDIVGMQSFYVDQWAQLAPLAGARYEPPFPNTDFSSATYIQIYHTDKVMSHATGTANVFSHLAPRSNVKPDAIKHSAARLRIMRAALESASRNPVTENDNEDHRIDGAVRVEIRVPILEMCNIMPVKPTKQELTAWFLPFDPTLLA